MPTKLCPKCNKEIDISNFHKNKAKKDGLQSYCKPCLISVTKLDYQQNNRKEIFTARANIRRLKTVEKINEIKQQSGCIVCGEKDPCCLDFHHLKDKDKNISYWVQAKSLKRALDEIKKCVIICANCHRKLHAGKIALGTIAQ